MLSSKWFYKSMCFSEKLIWLCWLFFCFKKTFNPELSWEVWILYGVLMPFPADKKVQEPFNFHKTDLSHFISTAFHASQKLLSSRVSTNHWRKALLAARDARTLRLLCWKYWYLWSFPRGVWFFFSDEGLKYFLFSLFSLLLLF